MNKKSGKGLIGLVLVAMIAGFLIGLLVANKSIISKAGYCPGCEVIQFNRFKRCDECGEVLIRNDITVPHNYNK